MTIVILACVLVWAHQWEGQASLGVSPGLDPARAHGAERPSEPPQPRSQSNTQRRATDREEISAREIEALIRQLAAPSFADRQAATRRFCAIGPAARASLHKAVRGDDFEAALRARELLVMLDRVYFAGVEISLSFSRSSIKWNETVNLRITMTNRSRYPAIIPFEESSFVHPQDEPGAEALTQRQGNPNDDARQVGLMLDIADWLRVTAPDGIIVEFRTNDITLDPTIEQAVQRRVEAGPSSVLDAGRKATVTLPSFNRGFARYPLLDQGVYTVVVDYTPAWDDKVLATQRAARAMSNRVSITVTAGAPPAVSRDGLEASLIVEQRDNLLLAKLTNHVDQPRLINRNFGDGSPFASAHWLCIADDQAFEVPFRGGEHRSWDEFDAKRLVEAQPGQSVELARISLSDLRSDLIRLGVDHAVGRWTVHAYYYNGCDRQWQRRQGSMLLGNPRAPAVFQSLLPKHLLVTRQYSNPVTVPAQDRSKRDPPSKK